MSRPLPCRPFRKQKYPKITLDTPETPETRRMAENLYRYNEFITQHCIAFDLPDSALVTIAKAMAGNEDKYKLKHIDFSMVQLRRIFSRGDMSLHGRFYGGWWQSIPSKDWAIQDSYHHRRPQDLRSRLLSSVPKDSLCP